jgi:PKD domain
VLFKPKDPGGEEEFEVEGVAVDPSLKRVYLLALELRPHGKLAQEVKSAGQLYAFSTEQKGSELQPAPETTEGVLADTEVLEPQSQKAGVSLLEPSGITVDPVSHSIIVAGSVDRNKIEEERVPALQKIESNGKLGARWIDETNSLEECECLNSPVVSPTNGKVYVLNEFDGIEEIPSNFSSSTGAKLVFSLFCEEVVCPFHEKLLEFPGANYFNGAQMSVGPEGKLYVRARIRTATEEEHFNGGLMIVSPTLEELGWAGGASPVVEKPTCAVNDVSAAAVISAGGGEDVFMLSRFKTAPQIVEFGPNGGGCPHGTTKGILAKAGGVKVEQVAVGQKVTLSSEIIQANALSVEWEFGDGTSKTVPNRQEQLTEVEHTYTTKGTYTVTEKIHSDNLATPLIEVKRQLAVVGPPTIASEEATVSGMTATLSATVNPNSKPTTCKFEYGKVAGGTGFVEHSVACPKAPGTGEVPVAEKVEVSGLSPHTEYEFRLQAENSTGESLGKGTIFKVGPPPAVVDEAVSVKGETTATLSGKVNPNGETTECRFEYGQTSSYGTQVACPSTPGAGEASVAESIAIGGLKAGSPYHYRIVASNKAGETAFGADMAFTTSSPPPPPPPPPPPGGGEVLHEIAVSPSVSASLTGALSKSFAFSLKLTCPAGATACEGTVTVRSAKAVAAKGKHKAILTLATGRFKLGGGQVSSLTLHLSSVGKAVLLKLKTLGAKVAAVAKNVAGETATTNSTITLKKHR